MLKIKKRTNCMSMTFSRKHADVASVMKATIDDKTLIDEVRQQVCDTILASTMAMIRNAQRLTQSDVAVKMGCGQAKVSKLERGFDDDIAFGDLKAFAKATGHRLEVIFRKEETTLVDEIKQHAGRMKQCFDQLALFGQNDHEIARGLAEFYQEALYNLVKLVVDNQSKLPKRNTDKKQFAHPPVRIEVDDDETFSLSHESRDTSPV